MCVWGEGGGSRQGAFRLHHAFVMLAPRHVVRDCGCSWAAAVYTARSQLLGRWQVARVIVPLVPGVWVPVYAYTEVCGRTFARACLTHSPTTPTMAAVQLAASHVWVSAVAHGARARWLAPGSALCRSHGACVAWAGHLPAMCNLLWVKNRCGGWTLSGGGCCRAECNPGHSRTASNGSLATMPALPHTLLAADDPLLCHAPRTKC